MEIEDALKRLDELTQGEVQMATAQLLTLTHSVNDKVTRIDDKANEVMSLLSNNPNSVTQRC
jgi:hypothetical protein